MSWKQVALVLMGGGAAYVVLAVQARPDTAPHLAGIADPVPVAFAETSGTRLKAKFIQGADGSKIFDPEVLHDSQLDVDCVFRQAADGDLRCLPMVEPRWLEGWVVFFTDDQCTNAIALVEPPPNGCTLDLPPYFLRFDSPPFCGASEVNTHVYPVGSLLGPPPAGLHALTEVGCTPQPGIQNRIAYSLGAEVAASTFAAGSAGTDP